MRQPRDHRVDDQRQQHEAEAEEEIAKRYHDVLPAFPSAIISLEFDFPFQPGVTAFIFLLLQPEKQISLGRCIGDAVVDDGAEIVAPGRRGEIGVGLQRPAGHGILAAAHRAARIGLADGAADGKNAAGAGAAAAGDLIPVDRVALGV